MKYVTIEDLVKLPNWLVKVIDVEQSKRIQEACFAEGIFWCSKWKTYKKSCLGLPITALFRTHTGFACTVADNKPMLDFPVTEYQVIPTSKFKVGALVYTKNIIDGTGVDYLEHSDTFTLRMVISKDNPRPIEQARYEGWPTINEYNYVEDWLILYKKSACVETPWTWLKELGWEQ